jgi:flagellar basal body-associated protein FliL
MEKYILILVAKLVLIFLMAGSKISSWESSKNETGNVKRNNGGKFDLKEFLFNAETSLLVNATTKVSERLA